MAGGAGERFWPLSRVHYPKQLLKIAGNRSMLSAAVERVMPMIAPEDIYVITSRALKPAIEAEAGLLPPRNIIAEPIGRNTAACLALASALLQARYGNEEDVVMVVLTADHFILDTDAFVHDVEKAIRFAETTPALITFGIPPNRAETGYGYIEQGPEVDMASIWRVASFREKPDLETAQKFVDSGDFLWNSGMFVWRNSVLRAAFDTHLPTTAAEIPHMVAAFHNPEPIEHLAECFERLIKVSVDVAVLEKAQNVYVVKASFDWDDIGTWSSLRRLLESDEYGNVVFAGQAQLLRCKNSIVYSSGCNGSAKAPLVVGYNLRDMVIVNTGDAILVMPASAAQELKDVVACLREKGLNEYL